MKWLLLALLLFASVAHAQPYPRIGAYVGVRSGGYPLVRTRQEGTAFVNFVDSVTCRNLARFPIVAIDVNALNISPAIVPTLRYYNPRITIAGYHLMTSWWLADSFVVRAGDNSLDARWHNAIKGTGGFLKGVIPEYQVNWGQRSTADALAAVMASGVASADVDGFFGDFMSPVASWVPVGNDFTDQARIGNMLRFLSAVRAAGRPGFVTYGNGVGAERLGLNGTMKEGYPGALTNFTQAMTQKDGDWLKSEHTVGTYGDPRIVRMLLGTACLTGATVTYGSQVPHGSPWQAELWFPEYAVDPQGNPDPTGKHVGWLGYPYGPAAKLASGLYVRHFQNGIVLVNPTANEIVQDMLYPRWKHIGVAVPLRVVTIGPMDAAFLWGE